MKLKPILIASTCVILLVGLFLIVRSKTNLKADKPGIDHFLSDFNARLQTGNNDSLLACFDDGNDKKAVSYLMDVLTGKTITGKTDPLFDVILDMDNATIKFAGSQFATARIKVTFKKDGLETKHTVITFTLHQVGANSYKIYKVNTKGFFPDYYAYKDVVIHTTFPDKVVYSPITLAAFKTAESLKTRYDSVIWFAHLEGKTFFYVIKGKWNSEKDINRTKDSVIEPYKMGMVNPRLKEIIPAEYDLIHNINGTFRGMVEVEKGDKKGFYNLDGKMLVPANYDQIFPVDDDANLAVLRSGSDYFYLKNDTTISEKVNLKISDFFSKIKGLTNASDLNKNALAVVTEYNSKYDKGAIYIPPSYLVNLGMIGKIEEFKNPLRQGEYQEVHARYEVALSGKSDEPDNWLEASFYSIRDYFLGGRSEFYDKKNIVIVDKKHDRIFTQDIGTDYTPEDSGGGSLEGRCNVNTVRAINDSLFEVKAGAILEMELYDSTKTVTGGPYYHYLAIKNNKLTELRNDRNFGFTKYVKMDDSYLTPCYNMRVGGYLFKDSREAIADHITPDMLRYMKNEIYADYAYQFKDKRWNNVFNTMPQYSDYKNGERKSNVNVDDSLTEIDKYNINWIVQKLKGVKASTSTLASK